MIKMQTVFIRVKAITKVKGQEPRLYEALRVIAGPFFKFTIVKMKGPNKNPLNINIPPWACLGFKW